MNVAVKVRLCPNCDTERGLTELYCQGELRGELCQWDLTSVPVTDSGAPPPSRARPAADQFACVNGHPMGAGDLLCAQCGGNPRGSEEQGTPPADVAAEVEGWRRIRELQSSSRVRQRFVVARISDGHPAVLTLYATGSEPDPAVYDVLRVLPRDHVAEILQTGRWNGRAFEVNEELTGGTLADLGLLPGNLATLSRVVAEVGAALNSFAEHGLRHRDLRPGAIIVRRREPLDLVITSFGSARLSEFDLDVVSPLETTRYTSPESIAGGVAAASDWWSLGMILLEQVTRGACFEGINDQAFLIHVLTNGAPIPEDVDPRLQLLLRGLLARDRRERWGWAQVTRWLAGESPPAPVSALGARGVPDTRATITLAGRMHATPKSFALAAADGAAWEEARTLLMRGAIVTWAQDAGLDARVCAWLREIVRAEGVPDDFRLALVLKQLNPSIPLICRGEIVTPGWLLDHLEEGHALVSGPVPDLLQRMEAEPWLTSLKSRAASVRDRAAHLEIHLEEDDLRVHVLATSRSRLAALWSERRMQLPDSDHPAVLGLIERRQPSDEDLILLLSASPENFRTPDELLDEAASQVGRVGLSQFDRRQAAAHLRLSRAAIYQLLETRLTGFVRSGLPHIDEWVDQFRLERRLSLARTLVVLAVPIEAWREPPGQQYVATLMDFFSRRVANAVLRGPLSRMVIGKSSARADLMELGTQRVPASLLLDRILLRGEQMFEIDPAVFTDSGMLERRVRHLHSHATLYRRDSGIDGLYLGFPFILMQDERTTARPRIAPVLLWPIRLRPAVGAHGHISFGFDRDREEVRLNPALEGLLGPDVVQRWRSVAQDVLQRQTLNTADVMDAFGTLMPAQERTLTKLPNKDARAKRREPRLVCSAVIFHLAYVGQAIAEDLRQLKGIPPTTTALETALRLAPIRQPQTAANVPELERFFTAESDPSQEAAVFEARAEPGLVIEGPPGTGKSQTIVNMVADAIGRGQSVLIVCQKHAALDVVRKRLVAEGFGNRIVMINDLTSDRERVVRAVREQLEGFRTEASTNEQTKRARTQLAARMQSLKADLDAHHAALHAEDQNGEISYRELLGDLLMIEQRPEPAIDVPALRGVTANLDIPAVTSLEDACGPLARYWLPAKYEDSPLSALEPFGAEKGALSAFEKGWDAFVRAEVQRDAVASSTGSALFVSDGRRSRAWVDRHGPVLRRLDAGARERLARWLPLFDGTSESDDGLKHLAEVADIRLHLQRIGDVHHDAARMAVARLSERSLRKLQSSAEPLAEEPDGWLARFSPLRWLHWRRVRSFLAKNAIARIDAETLVSIVHHEGALRPTRARLAGIIGRLRPGAPSIDDLRCSVLAKLSAELHAQLGDVRELVARVRQSPHARQAIDALSAGTAEALEAFVTSVAQGCERHAARSRSLASLTAITGQLTPEWLTSRQERIEADATNNDAIGPIAQALPTLAAFQRFRAHAKQLNTDALAAFRCLRSEEAVLQRVPTDQLDAVVRNTISREARLAWKARLENSYPVLLTERSELEAKQRSLADVDTKLRAANRTLLVEIDRSRIRPAREWEDITRLRGQRARRLREFLMRGGDLGLMALRPIWLMNPDTASRLLPLKPGLFDILIFDEASQMPVEFAVPALYRSRVVVVSGDEKQMPPTAFFTNRTDGDEDDPADPEQLEEALGEERRQALQMSWNRREIKDCPDLLQLAKTTLPTTTLKIHYRSSFRELIAFSNASFYRNDLNIPVRHPDERVRREQPIQVLRADGVYEDQTNLAEAELVVEVLKKLWIVPTGQRKTCGVVTFNVRQADLIEDRLEARAKEDAPFRDALTLERERFEDGEDVRFFVKNVENVQGDERDVIVFSSTFGRNAQGTFRRHFGVLGQIGGERRLNVAVTRAKERVVLITSIPVAEVSDLLTTHRTASSARDFLQAYLEYARATSAGELDGGRALLTRLVGEHEGRNRKGSGEVDGFIRTVISYVHSLGHRAVALRDMSVFGVDLVIEDPRTGLYGFGIECDAPRHPLLADARAREVWRPALLARSIARVHRVSSHAWYVDRAAEQARLHQAIEEALG